MNAQEMVTISTGFWHPRLEKWILIVSMAIVQIILEAC